MLEILYPGHCGYKSETGGMLGPLRELTANQGYYSSLTPFNLSLTLFRSTFL